MDERRVMLAVFLMIAFVYVYSVFFMKPAPKPRTPSAPASGQASPASPAAPIAPQPQQQAAPPAVPQPAQAASVVGEQAERTITVETRLVHAEFTNRGGELVSWRLKRYLDDSKRPLEMVVRNLSGAAPHPFTLRTEDPAVTARLDEAFYRASTDESVLDATRAPVRLTFEYQDASGLQARKDFVIGPDSYVVQFDARVSQGDRVFNPFMVWGPGVGDASTSAETSRYLQKPEAIYFDQSIRRIAAAQLTPEKCEGQRTEDACSWEANFRFAGVDDHYFASVVLPRGRMRVDYRPTPVPIPGQPNQSNELVSYAVKVARATPGMRVFVGPKDFDVLRAADPQAVQIINFGMFAFLAVPLLRGLTGINAYVGNYGWAIVILTLLINAVMFPLRHKSMVSMRKMQAIQPQIKAIQDRYAKLKATDPARSKMNTEMMDLYRSKGVNPASGCLPMLLTMPVLFAFYAMLGQAIEVRGAAFGLWIQDLSRYDPYYVLPILMGITMLWQQKMTPSSVDPAQQKMMLLMPIMFTAFFLWAPSGLALYFLFSNLLAIGQQYLTNRLIAPAPARPVPVKGKR